VLAFVAAALAAIAPASTAEPVAAAPAAAASAATSPAAEPAASASDSDVLDSSVAWWEKVTVTVDDKGKQHSCRYEASLSGGGAKTCDKAMADSIEAGSSGQAGVLSRVTFERRFSPGGQQLDSGQLQPGDTLLGRQVMFLTFDADGAIASCKVVATSGDAAPTYDCDQARKEQFRAQASADPGARQAFMTILAYGHTEEIA
jgi:hypothetical protein